MSIALLRVERTRLRRLWRKLWRIASTCMLTGMALAPFAPPPPPPPPPPIELRAESQQRPRAGRRLR